MYCQSAFDQVFHPQQLQPTAPASPARQTPRLFLGHGCTDFLLKPGASRHLCLHCCILNVLAADELSAYSIRPAPCHWHQVFQHSWGIFVLKLEQMDRVQEQQGVGLRLLGGGPSNESAVDIIFSWVSLLGRLLVCCWIHANSCQQLLHRTQVAGCWINLWRDANEMLIATFTDELISFITELHWFSGCWSSFVDVMCNFANILLCRRLRFCSLCLSLYRSFGSLQQHC